MGGTCKSQNAVQGSGTITKEVQEDYKNYTKMLDDYNRTVFSRHSGADTHMNSEWL